MRVLLDTHILLWAIEDSKDLSPEARRIVGEADIVLVSSISMWEVAIKAAIRKLDFDVNVVVAGALDAGFVELPVTWRHARAVLDLPHHHHDPFDRMLVAQAASEAVHLLTSDRKLGRYGEFVVTV